MKCSVQAKVFSTNQCGLGEGPLWHPMRQQLFWFDILGKQLLSQKDGQNLSWQFDEHVSCAGWIDVNSLLIASETQLFCFDLTTGTSRHIIALEADDAMTRSNDGRVDPWGGFWIGTMGKSAQANAGKIYRFYQGELTVLFDTITIPNAICFSTDHKTAYFADTPTQKIMKQALDAQGWPVGAAAVFVDLAAENLFPDGAVVDDQGHLWNAQWGAGRVARYDRQGAFMSAITCPAAHTTCPAFGGSDLTQLFITTATQDLDPPQTHDGQLYVAERHAKGQTEHRVKLER